MTNAITYRVYGQESNRNSQYELSLKDYENKAIHANIWENVMPPIYLTISMMGAAVIIWLGSRNVLGIGSRVWNVAAFTTYFSCYRKLATKASKSAKLFNSVQKAKVSWKRIEPYLEKSTFDSSLPPFENTSISFENVSFAYPKQKPLFENITFSVKAGQIIGITGAVACGKTTFGKMIIGEQPYQGTIKVGTTILNSNGGIYDSRIGYMGHQPQTFQRHHRRKYLYGYTGQYLGCFAMRMYR